MRFSYQQFSFEARIRLLRRWSGHWLLTPGESACRRLRNTAEAAFAPVKLGDRCFEIRRIEIRPHLLGKEELRVSALPQKKIAKPLLASGANKEIDVGSACAA